MKIKLKHLVPYLPYKLKCEVLNSGKEKEIGEMMAVYDDGSACFGNIVESEHGFEYVKPILRPLSDLTKEIEHNGEKFVPIDKLKHEEEQQNTMFFLFYGNIIDGLRYLEDVAEYNSVNTKYLSYPLATKLIEWHFDIFGLIKIGLAIDINTLKQ